METKIKEKERNPCIFGWDFYEVKNIYITGWILDFYNKKKLKKMIFQISFPKLLKFL